MGFLSALGTIGGGAVGAIFGGPAGAMAGASLGGSLGGALDQSKSVSDANKTQAESTAAAIGEQQRQYDLTRGDQAPYRAAGTKALGQLETENGSMPTAADVMSDPGYQFGLQQGQQAIDRKIAAAGGRVSGAAIKAAGEYGTNYATTGYSAAYQRRQDRLNRLAALAGVGQTSTNATGQFGANTSNQISDLLTSQGNASGSARIAQGNIWGNATNQLGAIGQKWASGGGWGSGSSGSMPGSVTTANGSAGETFIPNNFG